VRKFITDAMIAEGSEVGTIHKVCANSTCLVHHPKLPSSRYDGKLKAEQEKERKEQATAFLRRLMRGHSLACLSR
jgi:ParB family chromosome partitioning protein